MEPWFNPNAMGWLFGTAIGILGGLYGILAGRLIPKGKGKRLILGLLTAFILLSASLLLAGLAAWLRGQPYGVWYALGLPGCIGTLIFSMQWRLVRRAYAQAELRKIKAQDL